MFSPVNNAFPSPANIDDATLDDAFGLDTSQAGEMNNVPCAQTDNFPQNDFHLSSQGNTGPSPNPQNWFYDMTRHKAPQTMQCMDAPQPYQTVYPPAKESYAACPLPMNKAITPYPVESMKHHMQPFHYPGPGKPAGQIMEPFQHHTGQWMGDRSMEGYNSVLKWATEGNDVQEAKVVFDKKGNPVKPKRPLSAFNYFFSYERARILGSPVNEKLGERASKYHRRHRKTHGRISFKDLAKYISQKWKQIDPHSLVFFEDKAARDLKRYRKAMKMYKEAVAKAEEKEKEKEKAEEKDKGSKDKKTAAIQEAESQSDSEKPAKSASIRKRPRGSTEVIDIPSDDEKQTPAQPSENKKDGVVQRTKKYLSRELSPEQNMNSNKQVELDLDELLTGGIIEVCHDEPIESDGDSLALVDSCSIESILHEAFPSDISCIWEETMDF